MNQEQVLGRAIAMYMNEILNLPKIYRQTGKYLSWVKLVR